MRLQADVESARRESDRLKQEMDTLHKESLHWQELLEKNQTSWSMPAPPTPAPYKSALPYPMCPPLPPLRCQPVAVCCTRPPTSRYPLKPRRSAVQGRAPRSIAVPTLRCFTDSWGACNRAGEGCRSITVTRRFHRLSCLFVAGVSGHTLCSRVPLQCVAGCYMTLMMVPPFPRKKDPLHYISQTFLRKAPRAVFRLLTSFSSLLVNCMCCLLC